MHQSFAAGVAILLSIGMPVAAAETPKRGGTLTYMIPADAPRASTAIAKGRLRRFTRSRRSTVC
jgi:hypothetical protein